MTAEFVWAMTGAGVGATVGAAAYRFYIRHNLAALGRLLMSIYERNANR